MSRPNFKLLNSVMKMEDSLRTHMLNPVEEIDLLTRLLAARISESKPGMRDAVVQTLDEYLETLRTKGPRR